MYDSVNSLLLGFSLLLSLGEYNMMFKPKTTVKQGVRFCNSPLPHAIALSFWLGTHSSSKLRAGYSKNPQLHFLTLEFHLIM